MKSGWQTHKGKQIFICQYASLSLEELQAEVNAVDAFIGDQSLRSVCMLTDLRGQEPSRRIVSIFIKSASFTKKFLRKSAVIGIDLNGKRKALFDAVIEITGANVVLFEDAEKAKDWLAED